MFAKSSNPIIFICLISLMLIGCQTTPRHIILLQNSIPEDWDKVQQWAAQQELQVLFKDSLPQLDESLLRQTVGVIIQSSYNARLTSQEKTLLTRYKEAGGTILALDFDLLNEYETRWLPIQIQQSNSRTSELIDLLATLTQLSLPQYRSLNTPTLPEENRFSKQVLDFNLDEPMEMAEIPKQGILLVERRGAIKFFDFNSNQTTLIDTLPVAYQNEDGLLGLAVDPNYPDNHWIYLFYSPPTEEPIQRISRFEFADYQLDRASEKIILEFPLIRKCCHSGGGLEFGPDGLLYIGTGDNTNPFESNGFAPIDERPGRALWDAQKSAANTNDLRGKILRIQPEADGTYSIPAGNLFPEGTPNTRPEIYVMGCRNPFRFDIDPSTGYLYWGDVGPDAGQSDSTRGPKGMGEFNQARQAGFWGWPYTRGNNQSYRDYDFTTQSSGPHFDPQAIINNSPNNSGLQELPPVQSSFIWYSYDSSEEFPWLDKGGVNPMAGPVYRSTYHGDHFPEYFEGKLFVYEWMRDWIYVVTMDKNGEYVKADPFMPNTEFSHPMDMFFATDGHLYLLEYGQKWNAKNLDARLSKITYNNGNRAPSAKITASQSVGKVPLTVEFSAQSSVDFDGDPLRFNWKVEPLQFSSKGSNTSITFDEPGIYTVELEVVDPSGNRNTAFQKIIAGNSPPTVEIQTDIQDFVYWKNRKIPYKVLVTDEEDGESTQGGGISQEDVQVTLTYIPEGKDAILAHLGHQQGMISLGEQLVDGSDCKACHGIQEKVNGPSYLDIASRYSSEDKNYLISKIIKGGSGVWGEAMMSAHPQLSVEETGQIVDYILSLDPSEQPPSKNMPLEGTIAFDMHNEEDIPGKYLLNIYYLDKGHPSIPESKLSVGQQITFTPPLLEAESAQEMSEGVGPWNFMDATVIGSVSHDKHLGFYPIGFDRLEAIRFCGVYAGNYPYKGRVEIHKDSPDGPLLGQQNLAYYHPEKGEMVIYDIPLEKTLGPGRLYLVFKNDEDPDQYVINPNWMMLQYNR